MRIKGKSKDPKRAEADRKRIDSMVQMKKDYKHQKDLIKEALSSVDVVHKNKIIFNNDEKANVNVNGNLMENGSDKRRSLFDDDDDEENDNVDEETYNFEVKEQFQGKKGQKLLELQARFKKDERFNMDKRFLDNDDDNNEEDVDDDKEETVDDEKKRQMQILQQVLGKSVPNPRENVKESQKAKTMLRFDPTQPEHSKYEIKEDLTVKKKKKKKVDDQSNVANNDIIPNVSKDTFYKVSEGLKDIFQEKQEFSLLSMFNQHVNKSIPENIDETNVAENITKKAYKNDTNPFKYDSSTDEEEEDDEIVTESKEIVTETKKPEVTPSRLWTESFFFKPDDYRLQDGLDFVKKMEIEELSEFVKLRRDLKQIVRSKVKNNQRKNKPFKKKLGGRKKMIKIKKAIKR